MKPWVRDLLKAAAASAIATFASEATRAAVNHWLSPPPPPPPDAPPAKASTRRTKKTKGRTR